MWWLGARNLILAQPLLYYLMSKLNYVQKSSLTFSIRPLFLLKIWNGLACNALIGLIKVWTESFYCSMWWLITSVVTVVAFCCNEWKDDELPIFTAWVISPHRLFYMTRAVYEMKSSDRWIYIISTNHNKIPDTICYHFLEEINK